MLRQYQIESVEGLLVAINDKVNTILQLPTGTGKTTVIAELVRRWRLQNKNVRTLIVVHRIELVDQMLIRLRQFGIVAGKIQSGHSIDPNFQIQVGLIQSLRNDKKKPTSVGLIIIDEAHHTTANSYQNIIDYYKWHQTVVIGVSATPSRLDGAPIGDTFKRILKFGQISDFVSQKFLSPMKHFATASPELTQIKVSSTGDYDENELEKEMSKDVIMADLIQGYEKHAKGKKMIVFAVNVRHAEFISQRYRNLGYSAVYVDYKTKSDIRIELIDKFRKGEIQILCNVNLFTEGFDCPDVEVVQLARPTKSLNLYLQMVGRGMRMFPGKEFGIILDNANLWLEHGLSSRDRDWDLTGVVPEKRKILVEPKVEDDVAQRDVIHPAESKDFELIEVIIDNEFPESKTENATLLDLLFISSPLLQLKKTFELYKNLGIKSIELRPMNDDIVNFITGQKVSYYLVLKKIQPIITEQQSSISIEKLFRILSDQFSKLPRKIILAHITYYFITLWFENENQYKKEIKLLSSEKSVMRQVSSYIKTENALFDLEISELFLKSISEQISKNQLSLIYEKIQEKYFEPIYAEIKSLI